MKPETVAFLRQVVDGLNEVAADIRRDGEAVKASQDHIEIIKHYNHLRIAMEQIKEARTALEDMKELLSRETVPEILRERQVKSITIEGVGRVSLNNRWSCSMPDKEAGMTWLRENGHGSLIQETVNSSTLAAFAKDHTESLGKDLPTDLFKTSIMTFTSVTKA